MMLLGSLEPKFAARTAVCGMVCITDTAPAIMHVLAYLSKTVNLR